MVFSTRELKEKQEYQALSQYAQKVAESKGRLRPEKKCDVRTDYERDFGRILFCRDFRRMRQKTQVFFNPRNDHTCTRMEHVLHVNYIASTIGKALGLNSDLIEAIAYGHDIGHAPFGHSGEHELSRCLKSINADFTFQHELHSLRVLDLLATRHGESGLNLTFEVRDGIVSHCGERYEEICLKPNLQKTEAELIPHAEEHLPPATLEGCVVRIADKIAYVGRDIEDAKRAGLLSFTEIPRHLRDELGQDNGEIINTLVNDVVQNSYGKNAICMSQAKGEALEELLKYNVQQIYQAKRIKTYEEMACHIIRSLFEVLMDYVENTQKYRLEETNALQEFKLYLQHHPDPYATVERKVTDYIAGMTDLYAHDLYRTLFIV